MFVTETTRNSSGQAWLLVRETQGWVDVAAHVVEATYDRHDDDVRRCIIDPPSWTFRLGVHPRFSLGSLIGHVGQAVYQRIDRMPVVHQHAVTDADLVERFGWNDVGLGDD